MPRPTARARGYTSAWDKARAAWLATHRTCGICGAPATVIHHRIPHRMAQARTEEERATARRIFWSREGWEPVCAPCHDGPCQEVERRGYHTTVGGDGLPTDPAHPFNQERT